MTAERERLFTAYAQDRSDEHRNEIVESFLPLAEFFASRYKNRGADQEDLRQVAKMALVKAADRFDPDIGVQFSTFAGRTIDGELKRYFRDKTWAVRVPRSLQELSLTVRRTADELAVENGRAATPAQIATATGLDIATVIEALDVQSSYRASSLDAGSSSDDDRPSLGDRLGSVDQRMEQTELQMAVEDLLGTLPEREQQVLRLRFFDECSQTEIAEQVGVSQMHVSRIIRRSLEELRRQMRPSEAD